MSEQTEKTVAAQDSGPTANSAILAGARSGVLGVKAGMTQIFSKDGDAIPVTVIDLKPAVVTQVKTKEKDGYTAVQIGLLPKKPQRATKTEKGHFKKSGAPGFYHVAELRVDSVDGLAEGVTVSAEFVKEGDLVDVTATSKGKGFQGGMKRYNMHGGNKTHGASLSHRSLGSIGNRADPAKCFKNKKMPGQMGRETVTIQNLRVVSVDSQQQILLIRGSVPGPKNGVVTVRKAVKG
ncbi:MAG: 50S ribosomal protein L3 [Bacteriovoracia bacterium]